MITFITGKPGGGKGLCVMREIEQILVNSDMPIITNLAIRIDPWLRRRNVRGKVEYDGMIGLRAYLLSKYGKDFDCAKRIRFLTDEEIPEFYLYRLTGPAAKCRRDEKGKVIDFDTSSSLAGPVCYVIDEAWKFYGSRQWQDTGKGVLFYTAQHRKFGDRVFLVTQNTKQVDTAMRQVSEDYWVVTNHKKKRIGFFRQPGVFSVSVFDQPPTAGVNVEPMARSVFKLDLGLAASYDTSSGVGVGGGVAADLGEKAKGLPIWVAPLLIVAVGFGLVMLAMGLGKGAGKLVTPGVATHAAVSNAIPSRASASLFGISAVSGPVANIPQKAIMTNMPIARVIGLAMVGPGKFWVLLEDGRQFRTGDNGLQEIRRDKVLINGVWHKL